jgi:Family of unknown function (DUF6677)
MNTRADDAIGDDLADSTGNHAPPEQAEPVATESHAGRKHAAWLAPVVLIAAWAIPGLGHALLRRWTRALGFFLAVGGLAILGYLMRGEVFGLHSQGSFGTLGFLADAAAGVFYFLAHVIEAAGPDISRATGNYGTRFVAAAGLVNLLAAIDAVELALGRRR